LRFRIAQYGSTAFSPVANQVSGYRFTKETFCPKPAPNAAKFTVRYSSLTSSEVFMKNSLIAAALLSSLISGAAFAAASVGQPAPDFTLTDVNGKSVKLADFKGKHVVLEWHNPACPFVVKHYDSNNMQTLQNKYDAKDTVWLSINSTAQGHQDFMPNDKLKAYIGEKKAAPDAYMTDADGKIGQAYGAKTTPHMYVINPAGMLVYAGAIDDKRGTNKEEVKAAKNFVVTALEESKAGKPISTATTQPYGCSVKYKS
jgi:peroxiredoxin